MRFQIGTAGTNARESKYQPETYLRAEPAQELVYRLCQGPVAANLVEPALLEGLELVGAVRVGDGQCFLNFTCFLKDDIKRLNEHGAEFGASLAAAVRAAVPASPLRGLRFLTRPEDVGMYLFFVVGCVVLDWHSCNMLAEKGHTLSASEMVRPGGGNFTIFGNELFDRNLRELYWGSHSRNCGPYWFTSFGDHDAERRCLPDLSWRLQRPGPSGKTLEELAALRKQSVESYLLELASCLTGENPGDDELRRHLEALCYLADGVPVVAVLVAQDQTILASFSRQLDCAVSDWIDKNHGALQGNFANLTPIRQGVSWREVLGQVWHYVFAHANRLLCKEGILYDPYLPGSIFRGYLPVVWRDECRLFYAAQKES